MKKTYQKPELTAVEIQNESALLTESIGVKSSDDTHTNGWGFGTNGDFEDND